MALGAATPDRAVIVRKTRTGARVDGQYIDAEAFGPVFRCRFRPETESESRDEAKIRKAKPATMTVLARDASGGPVGIRGDDQIEIRSSQWGTMRFEVRGAPRPIRKRRAIIGWSVELQRVNRDA
jgi:hypothetical protein